MTIMLKRIDNKMAVQFLAIFDFWMKWFYLFLLSMLNDASHQVAAQENIWVEGSCLKNSKKAV